MAGGKCTGCGKDIGLMIDFGGAYWSNDSDPYCSVNCHDNHIGNIAEIVSGPDEAYDQWIEGDDKKSTS